MRLAAMMVGATLALGACATDAGHARREKLALYRAHAGRR